MRLMRRLARRRSSVRGCVVGWRMALSCDGARVKFAAAPRIGIAYASKRDQSRKWRFTLRRDMI